MRFETPNLLITDDDRSLRETLASVFERQGYRTLLAEDGERALAIVEAEPVHLLVSDLHMPRLSGLDTIRRLRQHKLSLPCILMSAALDELVLSQAREVEVFTLLAKPLSFEEVSGAVHQALEAAYGWRPSPQ